MLVVIGLATAGAPSAAGAEPATYYPAFCQGIAIQGAQNRMFVSTPFSYPLKAAPETGPMRDAALGTAFAAEVKARAGQTLLDYSCYARADAAALDAFVETTLQSNKASWAIERLEWRPATARSTDAAPGAPPAVPAPAAASVAPARVAAPASTLAADQAAERKARQAAELAAQAEKAAEDARVKVAKAAEADTALRSLNGAQVQAASAALQKQEADQRTYQEQQKAYLANQQAYQEQQRAYRAAKADHEAATKAADDARKKWQADVAACAGGDRTRCAQEAVSR
ncbi:MAG: hypothetical protein KKB47_24715 [Alphaproteobacteria bacterium]|nr:hypothetical protein [Alphaproteobacteria bacterium]MBU1516146.1 hypothetical protein [Alphaproteobacteria bacterium]MBU2308464.1 hypothetical protein [Alphaproteobacteria bacterium]MBU2366082.1 hypothetical protein [Alphaproteobacteria bacterium]